MERFTVLLCRGALIAAGAALWALVLLATVNVALRLFGRPYSGTYEIVSFLGAVVIAGALAQTQRKKDHIVVDIVSEKFPPAVRRILETVSSLASLGLFTIVSWQVWKWGRQLQSSGELSETLKIPYHHFVYGVAAGFAILSLTLFMDVMRNLLGKEQQ